MKYLLYKDKTNRKLFLKLEKKKKCLKFLIKTNKMNYLNQAYLYDKINKLKIATLTKIKNRCALTNRSRGNLSKFRLSRIKLRNLLSLGLIPGYKKSIW